ncbi:MAG: oxygenase MpaB family protein [Actinomycetota bacterium]
MAQPASRDHGDRHHGASGSQDLGLFGPESVSWRVHRETTVLFGGARALLMHAAHPLVIAGARETGFYERDPWKRLERTLILTYALTFGTREEALAAAGRINEVHRFVRGTDPVTGLAYDAFDPELLLWVHACLVESALLFEGLTVGRLEPAERERFHLEQLEAAELLGLARERVPPTTAALRAYIEEVASGGILRVTDAARRVARLFRDPPRDAEWRPVLRAVSWWAFGTLPPPIRELYGVRWGAGREAALRASLGALRVVRPAIPRRFRWILPAQQAFFRRATR